MTIEARYALHNEDDSLRRWFEDNSRKVVEGNITGVSERLMGIFDVDGEPVTVIDRSSLGGGMNRYLYLGKQTAEHLREMGLGDRLTDINEQAK